MKNKIIIKEECEIEVKRFYIPHTIKVKCPNCGADVEFLGDDDYLSYPTLNAENNVYTCCTKCGSDLQMSVKIGMTIEYDNDDIKEQ